MDQFTYRNGTLHAEEKSIAEIAADPDPRLSGTPFYCYSRAMIEENARNFADGVKAMKPLICFAVKANNNPTTLSLLGQLGYGADVVSKGEILLALDGGIAPDKIVFSGTAKTPDEIDFALEKEIFQFNVESEQELYDISERAEIMHQKGKLKKKPRIDIRVNPNVAVGGHGKTSVGKEGDKFGVPIEMAPAIFALARSLPHLMVEGISVHAGSQIKDLKDFRAVYEKVRDKILELQNDYGISLSSIDLGGGLGVEYDPDEGDDKNSPPPPTPQEYGAMVADVFKDIKGKQFIFEPGRSIVADAGILVTKVINIARSGKITNVKVDAGMNDFMRPAMYDKNANHPILQIKQPASDDGSVVNVVGPVCESSDVFRRGISLPGARKGDLLAIGKTGAYGASMGNNYNSRLLIPEVLVDGDQHYIIRRRQTYKEMRELNQPVPQLHKKWAGRGEPAAEPAVSGHPRRQ